MSINNIFMEEIIKIEDISQLVGITEYERMKVLRGEFKSSLPIVEEIESKLSE
ncbi:MAG: hypothetical protein NC225_12465 [Clostridium sp.]|nr:hypothetical protein [Clostridium sp.]MCM1460474.1 hypothetical protein [Bacteroides sp.]